MAKKRKKKKKGFTLVELLAVICLIGIITAIAVPVSVSIIKTSQENKFKTDARTILKNVEMYVSENHIAIPEDGIAFETLGLELKGIENYTGVVVKEHNVLKLESITDNKLCGKGDEKTIEVSDDLSGCDIILNDATGCFTLDENGQLSDYDARCSEDVVIPTRVNGEPVKSLDTGLFLDDYDYLVGYTYDYDDEGNYYEYYDIYESFEYNNVQPTYSYPVKDIDALKKACYRKAGDKNYDLKELSYVNTEYAYCDIIGDIGAYKVNSIHVDSIDLSKAHYLEEIGDLAFYGNAVTSINFGNIDKLRKIGNSVFENSDLEGTLDLSMLPNLESIGGSCFNNNYIEEVKLPDSLKEIGKEAFSYNNIHTVVFGEGITETGINAFQWNALTSVTLPSSITKISRESFYGNWDLAEIKLDHTNLTTIEDYAFCCCGLKKLKLPETVTYIGNGAFDSMGTLESINIPSGVTYIGDFAFFSNLLKTFTLPESLQYLGNAAFSDNQTGNDLAFQYKIVDGVKDDSVLTSYAGSNRGTVTVPSNVTTIGSHAFRGGPFTNIIMNSVTKLEPSAFLWAQVRNLPTMPNITEIPRWGFYASAIYTLSIPSHITKIGEEAFHYSGIRNLTIPSTVTEIGNGAFNNNYVNRIIYARNSDGSEDTTKIVSYANRYGSYSPITIPSSVTTIAPTVNLNAQSIPSSVTTIGEESFDIRGFSSYTIPGSITHIPENAFSFSNNGGINVKIEEGVQSVGARFIYTYQSLSIELPSSIISIDPLAFKGIPVTKLKINKPEDKTMYGYPWGVKESLIEWAS